MYSPSVRHAAHIAGNTHVLIGVKHFVQNVFSPSILFPEKSSWGVTSPGTTQPHPVFYPYHQSVHWGMIPNGPAPCTVFGELLVASPASKGKV